MQVKKSIKKVGAVAGSALMVGMTMGSAASLSEFPQPFVDDDGMVQSQVVVGSQGKVADVVGAINVGAALGQSAVQTTENTVPGAESQDVDGAEEETTTRSDLAGLTLDKSDYSQLVRNVEEVDGTDHRTLEQVMVDSSSVHTDVNDTKTLTEVDANSLHYSVSYTPGFGEDQSITLLGDEYTITNIDSANNKIDLGSKEDMDGLELGDTFEHGPYTVEVIDKDESAGSSGAIYVEVSKNGDVLQAVGLEEGTTETFDDEALELTADDVFFGSKRDYIDVTSVHTDTTVEQGEDSPFDAEWDVESITFSGSGDEVEQIMLQNKWKATQNPSEDESDMERAALEDGDSFAGPADYFHVYNNGLEDHETEEVGFGADQEVTYMDGNSLENTVDMSQVAAGGDVSANDIVGAEDSENLAYPIEVDSVDIYDDNGDGDTNAANVTLSYQDRWSFDYTLSVGSGSGSDSQFETTGYGFGVTVEADDTTGGDGANTDTINVHSGDTTSSAAVAELDTSFEGTLTQTSSSSDATGQGDDSTVELAEDGTDDVVVGYDTSNGEIVGVNYEGDGTATLSDTDGVETLSNFGSHVSLDSTESATVMYPEEARDIQHAVGSQTTESGSDQTYQAVDSDAMGMLPSMAMQDAGVTESHKQNNHLVLVGGPAVNTLVSDLVDSGDVNMPELEGQSSGALVSTVDDAFADGQHAMVVAGVGASDTRQASEYLANYASHEQALADAGSRMVLEQADYPSEQ